MSRSESIDKIILEYDKILIRDLGFNDWKVWEPMILKIMDTLGVYSLGGTSLKEDRWCPGKKITLSLIHEWMTGKGKYWKNLVSIEESIKSTPYYDCQEYVVRVKTKYQLLEELQKLEIYENYHTIRDIFESKDYETLCKLDGVRIEVKI